MLVFTGHFDEGITWIERSHQLNPMDARGHLIFTHLALAHLGAGRPERAIEFAREAIRRKADFAEPYLLLASAFGYLGRIDEAHDALEPYKDTALGFFDRHPEYAEVTRDRILEGLRKAGISE